MKQTLMTLLVFITVGQAIADDRPDKLWTSRKTGKSAYHFCPGAKGLCSTEKMETDLKIKCFEAGYRFCETIFMSNEDAGWGSNVVCDDWRKNKCVVVVKGSMELK